MADTPYIINTPANSKGALDKLIGAGLIVGGLWYARKLYRDYKANKISDAAGGDPNIQAAIEIHQAIDGAGTAEKVLFDIAGHIQDWKAVSLAYRGKYQSDMLEDIKGDLSAADFQKFMNIYNLNKKDAKGNLIANKNPVTRGFWVYVEKDANVRKTARVVTKFEEAKNNLKYIGQGRINNVIFLAKAGKYLGVLSGRASVDTSTAEGTQFLEVMVPMLTGKTFVPTAVWVASSQVRTINKKGFMPKPGEIHAFTKALFDRALNGSGGIGVNTNYKAELVLNVPFASVMDENENFIKQVYGKDLILGFKDSEYANKSGERFFVFVTADGFRRMIAVNAVKEQKIP